jgi:hypothetical protein
MRLYQLTKQDRTTHEGYEFGVVGKVHSKEPKENPKLCSNDVFHAYENLNLAFLMNPMYTSIKHPRVWELEGDVVASDSLRVGSFTQEVLRELEVPSWVGSPVDRKIRVKFSRLCTIEISKFFDKPNNLKIIESAESWLEKSTKENISALSAASAVSAYSTARVFYTKIDFGELADEAVNLYNIFKQEN